MITTPTPAWMDSDLEQLDEWLTREKPVAVGEIGLDFYLEQIDPARQERLFAEQLRLAPGCPVYAVIKSVSIDTP